MIDNSKKSTTKKVIKDPLKLKQVSQWRKSAFCNVSSSFHNKERISFDSTAEFLDNCINFQKEEIESMLENGINIDCCDKDNLTALHQACINAKLELVEYLLSKNAQIDASDKEGWTPLHIAASIGSLELAKYLIDHGARLNITTYDGDLPISLVDEKEFPNLKIYLKKEMDKRNVNEDFCRNLERTVMKEDVFKWKSSGVYKPPIDAVNKSTPLHVAASKNYLDILEELIPVLDFCQLNAQDSDGWTSLHAAAHWGNFEACVLLIKAGADVDIVTNANETVLDIVDPIWKNQLTEQINSIRLENMRTTNIGDQHSINSDNLNKRSHQRSSIIRQSVEWKKNSQSKDPLLERQILSNAAQNTDISPRTYSIEEDFEKSSRTHKGIVNKEEYPSITETDEISFEEHLAREIEVGGTKSHSKTSVTSPSTNIKNDKFVFARPSDHLPEGDSVINSPSKEINIYNSFDLNNGASCDISETSSCSSESEKVNVSHTQVKIRPKRLSMVMAPSKCDESETNRREKARRVRSNRRSTQGISSDTVASIKRREYEIINEGVFRKSGDLKVVEETPEKELIALKDEVFQKNISMEKVVKSNLSAEKSVLDSIDSSLTKSQSLRGKFSDNRNSKLQHNNSLNLPSQSDSSFSKILPKAIISNRLGALIKSQQSTDNNSSSNIQRTSSMLTNATSSHQNEFSKTSENVALDITDNINKSCVLEENKECDSGSYVAKPVPGTRKIKTTVISDPIGAQSSSVLSQVKAQYNQSDYASRCVALEEHMSQEDIQKYKNIAKRIANDQNIKIELQVEISNLKHEIQDLKENREVVDAALRLSRNTNGDRISNIEFELVKTKEENRKLKLQNEALLRVISKIQQDLEVFKDAQLTE